MPDNKFWSMVTAFGTATTLLSACSDPPPPVKLVEIEGPQRGAAFYIYRPGSILDDYVTLEIDQNGRKLTLISISRCSLAAARLDGNEVNLALFGADFAASSATGVVKDDGPLPSSFLVKIQSLDRDPQAADVKMLKQGGYTTVKCDL